MKKILLFWFLASLLFAQVNFDDYFTDKQMRLDYYHGGNHYGEEVFFDRVVEEPYWGGSHTALIDTFRYGAYFFKVLDKKKEKVLYSRGYSTLFREWQTTEESKKIKRVFSESVIFPFPKDTVFVMIFSRDSLNQFHKIFEKLVDPKNYFVQKNNEVRYSNFQVHYSGDPSQKLDIVFLPEGYTRAELGEFRKDCEKFKNYLFHYSPFKENKDKINIWAVLAPSVESGTDIPGKNIWKNTLLNSSYYTFNSERYLMTTDYKEVRDVAASAPYDQIYILVNSSKYGGGAIYNYYSMTAAKNKKARQIFVHEFGHGFGGLGDEYYDSEVSYRDFYNLKVEPWEPNLTTLVNFSKKWKDLVPKGVPVPTPATSKYKNVTGAFEGGGYAAKGIYRPSLNSIMRSFTSDEFNEVSKRALQRMIDFYAK